LTNTSSKKITILSKSYVHHYNCFQHEDDKNVTPGIYSDSVLDLTGIKYYEERLPNKYDDIIHKGSHIFSLFLEEGHPFVDGNKRTGFVTLWIFLSLNDYRVRFDYYNYNKHLDNIIRWANAEIESNKILEITEWIYDNSTLYIKIRRHVLECKNWILSSFR
jgi:prophage maintenance system killer protein